MISCSGKNTQPGLPGHGQLACCVIIVNTTTPALSSRGPHEQCQAYDFRIKSAQLHVQVPAKRLMCCCCCPAAVLEHPAVFYLFRWHAQHNRIFLDHCRLVSLAWARWAAVWSTTCWMQAQMLWHSTRTGALQLLHYTPASKYSSSCSNHICMTGQLRNMLFGLLASAVSVHTGSSALAGLSEVHLTIN